MKNNRLLFCLILSFVLAGCAGSKPVKPAASAAPPAAPVVQPKEPVPTPDARAPQVAAPVDEQNSVFFARGATLVDAAGENALRSHAERLRADPELMVTLVGSTDESGSRVYNMAIADKRVGEVYKLLRKFGVPALQIRRYSTGGEIAGRFCATQACQRLMRRVELRYSK